MSKERVLLEYLVSCPEAFAIAKPVLQPEYFEMENQQVVRFILDHASKYKILPGLDMIKAETGQTLEKKTDGKIRLEWLLDELEQHCRQQATIAAIMKATEEITIGNYSAIVDPIKEAVLLSLHRDLGLRYFESPAERLLNMNDGDLAPTGFKDIDDALFGGTLLGGLNFVAANSGVGKSFWLLNIAMNALERGKNVVYITLELFENFSAKRMDQMVSDMGAKEIMQNIDKVGESVVNFGKRSGGEFYLKYFKPQTRVSVIEAYLHELELRTEKKFDLVILDYLDLIMPNDQRVNINDTFTKDKFVAEELRGVMGDGEYHCWTASQLGREGIKSFKEHGEHSQADIAGGISKINTADTVISLATNNTLEEQGLIRAQFLKTRTSSGVGKVLPIGVDIVTRRMSDASQVQKDWFYNKDKRKPRQNRRNDIISSRRADKTIESTKTVSASDRLKDLRERFKNETSTT